jgi:uncharacterized protein YndB with AHSA1/START domain
MKVQVSTTIDRRPSEVFAFVADARNERRWHPDIIEIPLTGGDGAGAGTTYHVPTKPAMGVSEGAGTVLKHQPSDRAVFEWRMGKLSSVITHSVAAQGTGTRFTREIELRLPPAMRLATPVIRPMVRKANTQFLANLKQILEA